MRLLVRRIYRAFPELDQYADEQCRRFVRAANRGWRRGAHWFLIAIVVAGGLMLSLRIADWGIECAEEYQNQQRRDVVMADVTAFVASVPALLIGPLAALVVRDLLLRLRLRRILREDSSCPKCHYGLIGLEVSD